MTQEKPCVIITGGTGELGKCFIKNYAQDYHIIATGRTTAPKVDADFRFLQGHILEDSELIINGAMELYGKVDCIINSAVAFNVEPLIQANASTFAEHLSINVAAPLSLAQECFKQCWSAYSAEENQHHKRCVINISSLAGCWAVKGMNLACYSATKSALNMLSLHMAQEFKPYGIKVNCLAPGSFPRDIATELVCERIIDLWQNQPSGQIHLLHQKLDKPWSEHERP